MLDDVTSIKLNQRKKIALKKTEMPSKRKKTDFLSYLCAFKGKCYKSFHDVKNNPQVPTCTKAKLKKRNSLEKKARSEEA